MWKRTLQGGFPVSRNSIYSSLQECCKERSVSDGRKLHSFMIICGLDDLAALGDHLIRLFATCGRLFESDLVFCIVTQPSIHTWQAIISAHTANDEHHMAIQLYEYMQSEGIQADEFVFSSVLKACGKAWAREQGRSIHNIIVTNGLESNLFLGSSLVDMYVKHGQVTEARSVFNSMSIRNVISWGAMMAGYIHQENSFPVLELFESMQEQGIKPDRDTLQCVLNVCGSHQAVMLGLIAHDKIIKNGLVSDFALSNTLVDMYVKFGIIDEAWNVFDKILVRSVVSYGAIIRGHIQLEEVTIAMKLFGEMLHEDMKPNDVLFLHIIKACSSVRVLHLGQLFHFQIVDNGHDVNLIVGTALIEMYAKCGSLYEAHNVLMSLPCRDAVSWGIVISAYQELHHLDIVLDLYKEMLIEGTDPDEIIFVGVLKACGDANNIEQGLSIHNQIVVNALESNMTLENGLLDMYVRCCYLQEAVDTLNRFRVRNVVTWNIMIAGCTCHDNDSSALEFFQRMQQENIKPDLFTFSTLIKICSRVGSHRHGKLIHEQLLRSGIKLDVVIETTLVEMYAKCGLLQDAHIILNGMETKDVMPYNALISAYTQHGNYREAFTCFNDLQKHGLKPNADTYSNILTACNQSGALVAGRYYFDSMKEEGVNAGIEHINSITDLLGRLGQLEEAEKLLETMPGVADIVSWRSLLASCRTFGNLTFGRQCFNESLSLSPKSAACYALMSDIYASAEMWDDVLNIHKQKIAVHTIKTPGRAWIEVDNIVQEFIVGDKTHMETRRISEKLEILKRTLKSEGYLPLVSFLV